MKNLVSLIVVHIVVSMVLKNLVFDNLECIIEYVGGQAIITDKRPAVQRKVCFNGLIEVNEGGTEVQFLGLSQKREYCSVVPFVFC